MADAKEEKRELIIEKAIEAFERFGLRKTTMDDIARGCGLRKASLYYYFASKEEILAELIRRVGAEMHELMSGRVRAARTATEAFRAFSDLSLTQNPRGQLLLRLGHEDLFGMLKHADATLNEVQTRHARLLGEVLERGRREGEFIEVDAESVARQLFSVVMAVHVAGVAEGAERLSENQAALRGMMELVARGLRKTG